MGMTHSDSGGTRLDPWLGSYAARAHNMRASEIRALFSVASRPEVVSLAGGMPYIGGLPLEEIGEMMRRLVVEHGEIIQQGTHDELVAVDGLYRRFVVERKQAAGWKV